MNLRYDCYGASIKGKETRHPQVVMLELGISYAHATPQSMCDQWWFWNCIGVPVDMPVFLKPLNLNPHDQIGYGLSREEADNIAGLRHGA
jgi:hypothetical protein